VATPTAQTPFAVDPVQLPLVGGGATTLYTVPADTHSVLGYILVVNDNTTAVKVTLYYAPNGGAAGDDNIICKAFSIPGDGVGVNILEEMKLKDFHMETGGTIRGFADVADQATVHIGGWEYS